MTESLKDKNRNSLVIVLMANLVVFYGAVESDALIQGNWTELWAQIHRALPAGFGLVIAGILNAQFSADIKARIVFFRWSNPLPGSRAFSRYIHRDDRIDIERLKEVIGEYPDDPKRQNSLWYKLYKSVDSDPSVLQAHRDFLFSRDYNCMSLVLLLALGGLGFVQAGTVRIAAVYTGALLIQFLLTGQAARVHGRRFVTTVLALKAAGV